MQRTFTRTADIAFRVEFDRQDTLDKARCCRTLCNIWKPEITEVMIPSPEIALKFDKHILVVQDFAGLTVDLAVRPQNSNVETVNMCRTRIVYVSLAESWIVLPFLVHLVNFHHQILGVIGVTYRVFSSGVVLGVLG